MKDEMISDITKKLYKLDACTIYTLHHVICGYQIGRHRWKKHTKKRLKRS